MESSETKTKGREKVKSLVSRVTIRTIRCEINYVCNKERFCNHLLLFIRVIYYQDK